MSLTNALENLFCDRTAENVLAYEHARDQADRGFFRLLTKDPQTQTNGILRCYVRKTRESINALINDQEIQDLCQSTYETDVPEIFDILKAYQDGKKLQAFKMAHKLQDLPEDVRTRQSDLVIKAYRSNQPWAIKYRKILQEAGATRPPHAFSQHTQQAKPNTKFVSPCPEIERMPKNIRNVLFAYGNENTTKAYSLIDTFSVINPQQNRIESDCVIKNLRNGSSWAKAFAKIAREANTARFTRQHQKPLNILEFSRTL
ncbi:MAG TPA: hypothetical protein PK513_02650 [Alphaproteobacteria bacterium]|nr:hypothetical protein [Alphaproteobacteria bacterium]USO05438.1 MAG: hypothetical protein H6859_09900 [Rhodospirillales bacterium]HOO81385.1 hypothetical protein [Alphaproteobacteria bacterium]